MQAARQLDFEPLQPTGDHNFSGHEWFLCKERVLFFLSLKPRVVHVDQLFDCLTIKKVIGAAQSVSHRCMGKTCGFAAVLAATAATAAGPRGRNPISESTVKQSEK